MKFNFNFFVAAFLLIASCCHLVACSDDNDLGEENIDIAVSWGSGTLNFGPAADSKEIGLTSNGRWLIDVTAETAGWITVAPLTGTGNATITVSVAANPTDSLRTATVKVTGHDGKNHATVKVTQNFEGGGQIEEPKGTADIGDGSDSFEITSDMTLNANTIYTLKGFVYVVDGVTLTIEPGTIILGDKASKATLIVERGGMIMAQGTAQKPIVFTSAKPAGQRAPGDWGGIIICGKAPNNETEMTIEGGVRSKHGGADPADNSGVLSYVRCEFAGVEYSTDNEINGITFGSVGSGTKIDHLQVSYSGDDAYEWFGGTVNASHLVAIGTWDDEFDTDNGFSGNIQFIFSLRDPEYGDKSASNGFESDNKSDAANVDPHTSVVFANATILGPVADPANYTDRSGVHGSPSDARFQAAMHLRRNTNLSVFNSVLGGYPIGLIIENDKGSDTQGHAASGNLNVTNCVMAGMVKDFQDAQYWENNSVYNPGDDGDFSGSYFTRNGGGNTIYQTLDQLGFTGNPLLMSNPGVFPASSSPLATGAAWTNAKVSSGFEKVDYIGAFGPGETASSNWMSGWTNFDPQNTEYK